MSNPSSTLEKCLRELHDAHHECSGAYEVSKCKYDCGTMDDLRTAARIGAELEREACIAIVEGRGVGARASRARGDK